MKVITLKTLVKDKSHFEEMMQVKEREIAEAQATLLRMGGALIYIVEQIEHIQKERGEE